MYSIKEVKIKKTKKSCPECHKENKEMALFCKSCGTPLSISEEAEKLLNDRYNLTSPLSAEGIEEVYISYDIRLNKTCAIKKFYKKGMKELSSKERKALVKPFEKEAQVLANIRHPHLPFVTDYFIEGDSCYLVMDYIEGSDLELLLEENEKGLGEKQVIEFGIQICKITEYLYNQTPPIIHGDIKTANLIIRKSDDLLTLVDLGTPLLQTIGIKIEEAIGSGVYAAPELYMGKQDIKSDIFSIGATLYELLTGELPEEPFKFKKIRNIAPKVSKETEEVIERCLAYRSEDRFPDIKELKMALLKSHQKNFSANQEQIKKSSLISGKKKEKEKVSKEETKEISVFIVDDDMTIRDTFSRFVKLFKGINVWGTAANGKEAIKIIEKSDNKPDVILMDLDMPFMNGIDATKKIKGDYPSINIIILTAFLVEEDFLECIHAGATGYLLKNETSWDELEKFIKKSAEGKIPVSYAANTLLIKALNSQKS